MRGTQKSFEDPGVSTEERGNLERMRETGERKGTKNPTGMIGNQPCSVDLCDSA